MSGYGSTLDRVVAVIAEFNDGKQQISSGYLVDTRLVLTCEHAIRDTHGTAQLQEIWVVQVATGTTATVNSLTVVDPVLDVAVLTLNPVEGWPIVAAPIQVWGVDRSGPGVLHDCVAIGLPRFAYDPVRGLQGTAELHGDIRQTDGAETGHLLMRELHLHAVHDPATEGPGWNGLSGALVFYRGRAVGVIDQHHPHQGDNSVRLIGFDRITTNQQIRDCLQLPEPPHLAIAPAMASTSSADTFDDATFSSGERIPELEPSGHSIERPLDNAIVQHFEAFRDPLILWGDSGNGKTHAALKWLAKQESVRDRVLVRCTDRGASYGPSVYHRDLLSALSTIGVQAATWSEAACEQAFFRHLTMTDMAAVVDDINTEDLLQLVPTVAVSRVVFTRRNRPPDGRSAIHVDAFTPDQALDALREHLPALDSGHAKRLAQLLGYRPIAIQVAARLVSNGLAEVPDLLEALGKDASGTLDAAHGCLTQDSLPRFYSKVCDLLRTRRPIAFELMLRHTWLTVGATPIMLHEAFAFAGSASPAEVLTFDLAMQELVDLALLVRATNDVVMNELTQNLLRNQTLGERSRVSDEFVEKLLRVARTDTSGILEWSSSSAERRIQRATIYLRACAVPALVQEDALQQFVPQSTWGVLPLHDHAWLLWSGPGAPLITESPAARERETILVQVEDSGVVLWEGTSRRWATTEEAVRLRAIVQITHLVAGLVLEFHAPLTTDSNGLPWETVRPRYGDNLHGGVTHFRLVDAPSDVLRRIFGNSVYRCGRTGHAEHGWSHHWGTPQSEEVPRDFAACPECLSTRQDLWDDHARFFTNLETLVASHRSLANHRAHGFLALICAFVVKNDDALRRAYFEKARACVFQEVGDDRPSEQDSLDLLLLEFKLLGTNRSSIPQYSSLVLQQWVKTVAECESHPLKSDIRALVASDLEDADMDSTRKFALEHVCQRRLTEIRRAVDTPAQRTAMRAQLIDVLDSELDGTPIQSTAHVQQFLDLVTMGDWAGAANSLSAQSRMGILAAGDSDHFLATWELYAASLGLSGRSAEAIEEYREFLLTNQLVVSSSHRERHISALQHLARILVDEGLTAEAQQRLFEVAQLSLESSVDHSSEFVQALKTLHSLYKKADTPSGAADGENRWSSVERAKRLMSEAARDDRLGPEACWWTARVLADCQRDSAATRNAAPASLLKAIDALGDEGGATRLEALEAYIQLAWWYAEDEDFLAAAKSQRRVLALGTELFPTDIRGALLAKHNLAVWTGRAGDLPRAVDQLEEVLAERRAYDPSDELIWRGQLRQAQFLAELGDRLAARRALEELLASPGVMTDQDTPDILEAQSLYDTLLDGPSS